MVEQLSVTRRVTALRHEFFSSSSIVPNFHLQGHASISRDKLTRDHLLPVLIGTQPDVVRIIFPFWSTCVACQLNHNQMFVLRSLPKIVRAKRVVFPSIDRRRYRRSLLPSKTVKKRLFKVWSQDASFCKTTSGIASAFTCLEPSQILL